MKQMKMVNEMNIASQYSTSLSILGSEEILMRIRVKKLRSRQRKLFFVLQLIYGSTYLKSVAYFGFCEGGPFSNGEEHACKALRARHAVKKFSDPRGPWHNGPLNTPIP
jgi:hypothetical protein